MTKAEKAAELWSRIHNNPAITPITVLRDAQRSAYAMKHSKFAPSEHSIEYLMETYLDICISHGNNFVDYPK